MAFTSFVKLEFRQNVFVVSCTIYNSNVYTGTGNNMRDAFWNLEKALRNDNKHTIADGFQILRHGMSIDRL